MTNLILLTVKQIFINVFVKFSVALIRPSVEFIRSIVKPTRLLVEARWLSVESVEPINYKLGI